MGWASWSVDHGSNPTLGVHPLARSRCQGLVLGIVNLNAANSGQFGTVPFFSGGHAAATPKAAQCPWLPDGLPDRSPTRPRPIVTMFLCDQGGPTRPSCW